MLINLNSKHEKTLTYLVLCGCIIASLLMILRCFYGTELTDEAYYVSDAITMLHGNIPYAYNNYTYATGGIFLLIPQIAIYEYFVPSLEGVVIFSRVSFMLFWLISLSFVFFLIRKQIKPINALLYIGFLIPYSSGLGLYNYCYNTVSTTLTLVVSVLLYNAIECDGRYPIIKLFIAGFLMCLSVLAHPMHLIAILIFVLVILIRTQGIKNKVINICTCFLGGIFELLFIFALICSRVGIKTLIAGINNMLRPYQSGVTYHNSIIHKIKMLVLLNKTTIIVVLFVSAFVATLVYLLLYREQGKNMKKKCFLFGVLISIFIILLKSYKYLGNDFYNWRLGILGVLCMVILFVLQEYKKFPLLLYLGIYPIFLPFILIFFADNSVSLTRFVSAVPALGAFIIFMLEYKSNLLRIIAMIFAVVCILFMGLADYKYMYRDSNFRNLSYKVKEGVYKGILTSKSRAIALPELEVYLNSMVDDKEYYAFRDNVPVGYLMMHKGLMCDRTTWDNLNYTYHKNMPANLYAYYQRRGAFPTTIIYVDLGRDEKLSIEDDSFKYNEFVNKYYEKTDDIFQNSIIKHIIIYKYKGGFDGNFDYWINRYMTYKVE